MQFHRSSTLVSICGDFRVFIDVFIYLMSQKVPHFSTSVNLRWFLVYLSMYLYFTCLKKYRISTLLSSCGDFGVFINVFVFYMSQKVPHFDTTVKLRWLWCIYQCICILHVSKSTAFRHYCQIAVILVYLSTYLHVPQSTTIWQWYQIVAHASTYL